MNDRDGIVLACIDSYPKSKILLRIAANKAAEKKCSWAVIYIETAAHYKLNTEGREQILQYLKLAEEMGAKTFHIEGKSVTDSIISFVTESQKSCTPVKYIVIGKRRKDGIFAKLRPSIVRKIEKNVSVQGVKIQKVPISMRNHIRPWYERLSLNDISIKGVAFACASVFCAYVLSQSLQASIPVVEWRINSYNVTAFFLIACVITSLRHGLLPGLISAILSLTIMNYSYVPPLHQFGFEHFGDGISISIFLFSAVLLSIMGSYSRASNEALVNKEKRSQLLYQINRIAGEAHSKKQALFLIHDELEKVLDMKVAFFIPGSFNQPIINSVFPKDTKLIESDRKLLYKCWEKIKTTGFGADREFKTKWRFEPMITAHGGVGVMGIEIPSHVKLDSSFGRLCYAISDQVASITERIDLTHKINQAQITAEKEQLRSMLLSSVSHDLKTPLASIIGALSVHERMKKSDKLSPEIAEELIETALNEAQRLDSFITNILDITRIESGDIEFKRQWEHCITPVQSVIKRMKHRLVNHNLIIDIEDDEEIKMDLMMTEQVLQNVLDNAVKYSTQGKEIKIYTEVTPKSFSYVIRDYGLGIPKEKLLAIFDKYERLKHTDTVVAGTGLGLAICKAIMEKQNGTIYARNHPDSGVEFVISFPKKRKRKSRPLIAA
ncbi:MAG: ATP-binding protein [Rickettsiales bacterium]|nr:ATP-binding protein [Pseudomonadota bacterium]MDA0967306.1 ATP-binding protein [Pseudomonadota bacterium]MDG4544033.1 ATP-binding protein [Rickettsiales bacterium]MDG4546273.1 ATP-binding protein [Rickettsiales bacterium]MDG4548357.1 ATP-binding protein [Rickettsiales bacterium]